MALEALVLDGLNLRCCHSVGGCGVVVLLIFFFNADWPHPGYVGEQRLFLLMNNLLAGSARVLAALGSETACPWALCCLACPIHSHQRRRVIAEIVWVKTMVETS